MGAGGMPSGLYPLKNGPGSQFPHLSTPFTSQLMTYQEWQTFTVAHLSEVEI